MQVDNIIEWGVMVDTIVEANGAQLFCRSFGEGSPVVVLHGGPGMSHDYLLPYLARLADKHQVIFYDRRGCGRSTGAIDEDSMSLATFVEDLESVRKAYGFQQIALLGHSWGGLLAMVYAIAHPESVSKLILADTVPASSEEFELFNREKSKRMAPLQKELKAIEETEGFRQGDPETVEKYYQLYFCGYFYDPDQVWLLDTKMSTKAFLNGLKVSELVRAHFATPFSYHDRLKKLDTPTLILHADHDIIPPAAIESLQTSLRGSKYVLLKNSGHFPYIEAPEAFFKEVEEFLLDGQGGGKKPRQTRALPSD
ncbi:MAG: proline iminopeptidase-family hydrolase [Chlamydiia bacterium]